jgi:hypothetical protein
VATVLAATLRSKARTRADMVNGTFCTDAEVDEFIQSAWSELYDILVATFEDFAVTSTTIAVTGANDTYALPADFYKLRGVEYLLSNAAGSFVTLEPFEWSERGRFSTISPGGINATGYGLMYCLRDTNIVFAPYPTGASSIKVWYVPECPCSAVSITVQRGWEEVVVLDAAIQMLLKEESDVSVLMMRKQALVARIKAMAPKRDADAPKHGVRRRWGRMSRGGRR